LSFDSAGTPSESAHVLRRLFPFLIEVDASGRIDMVGARWREVAPEVGVGAQLFEVLAVERPTGVTSTDDFHARPNDVFLLALRSYADFKLRGQFIAHRSSDGAERMLFVGSPWINRIEDLSRFGLALSDFPPHDSRGDFLILLQSQESTLADMQLLTTRLRSTAEELERRNKELVSEMELRTQLEAQLRQSQKMEAIGRLAGGIAHDFNNILMAVQGYSALSLSRLGAGDPVRGWVEEIRKASDRAAALTRQLLAFSRQQVLRPAEIDLMKEVREVEALLRPLIGERIEFKLVEETDVGRVWADSSAIHQIVMNLALNARDAMPGGGVLEIRVGLAAPGAEPDGARFACVSVHDTGSGMDDATKARIFEPFFTTKEVGKGSGLGLATVYGLVEQCHGAIEVESEVGKGSTFRVRLPLITGPVEQAGRPATGPALGGRGERVLLIEDEPLVRRLLEQLLMRAGYQAVPASDPLEALARVERERPFDLIVTDVVMASMSGPELVERIEALRGPMPTIFMSGHTDHEKFRKGRLASNHRFMPKPFAPADLLTLVREVMASASR
jgi:signal transduction histidine kinase/CheY-like chemotaxis protein